MSELKDIKDMMREHNRADDVRFREIGGDIKSIKENHLEHIQNDITELKINVKWLMKFFWIVSSASIGGLITGIINLYLKLK